jgi:hypothetical protein
MAAIFKFLKIASSPPCTPLKHPPHPQKVSFALVEGFESYGLDKIELKKKKKKGGKKKQCLPFEREV